MARTVKDLVGKVFGKLTVRNYHSRVNKITYWQCQCECGNYKVVAANNLKNTKSCGCVRGSAEILFKDLTESLYNTYKRNAKRRKLAFDLPLDLFACIIKQPCKYCGKEPSTTYTIRSHAGKKIKKMLYTGIDRVDNIHGYIKSNVVPCCAVCNRLKGTLTEKEFFIAAHAISEHWKAL